MADLSRRRLFSFLAAPAIVRAGSIMSIVALPSVIDWTGKSRVLAYGADDNGCFKRYSGYETLQIAPEDVISAHRFTKAELSAEMRRLFGIYEHG